MRIVVTVCFILLVQIIKGQNISINDNLMQNSSALNVKMGVQSFGKIWNIRFGNYRVVSSRVGWTTTSSKTKLFDSRTSTVSKQKFSFVFSGNTSDTAFVNAVSDIQVKSLREAFFLSDMSFEFEQDLEEADNFFALISINRDSSRSWGLYLQTMQGTDVPSKMNAIISNGKRRIEISAITSDMEKDRRTIPAMGYEFELDGKVLGALQYFGGGLLGTNKNIVWIHNDAEPEIKLLLATASTAILQSKN